MPRGVPKAGFRRRRNSLGHLEKILTVPNQDAEVIQYFETDEEIDQKINERFHVLEIMTRMAIQGDINSLVVSGPAGLGKSYTVESELESWDPSQNFHRIVKGYVRPTALYKLLYTHRAAGQVLVFDDADEVFLDETSINLLKAALDSTERRIISYMTEVSLVDDETAERIPKSFQFDGTVIFITNYDFDAMIERGNRTAPHLQAFVSRSHYIDLAMKTTRDYLVRIRQVVKQGLLKNVGLDDESQADVLRFIESNHSKLRELSLRMALKLGAVRRRGDNWEQVARITCCKA